MSSCDCLLRNAAHRPRAWRVPEKPCSLHLPNLTPTIVFRARSPSCMMPVVSRSLLTTCQESRLCPLCALGGKEQLPAECYRKHRPVETETLPFLPQRAVLLVVYGQRGFNDCFRTHQNCPETGFFKCRLTFPPPPTVWGAPSGCGLQGEGAGRLCSYCPWPTVPSGSAPSLLFLVILEPLPVIAPFCGRVGLTKFHGLVGLEQETLIPSQSGGWTPASSWP